MRTMELALASALALAPMACSFIFAVSDDAAAGTRADGGSDGEGIAAEAGADSGGSADAGDDVVRTCRQTGRGPLLVNVGDRVCIDATEVMLAQYQAFVASGETPAGIPERCTSSANRTRYVVADAGDMPAFYVGWCDAFAYCAWAGKKLCGAFPGAEQDAGAEVDAAVDAGFSHGLAYASRSVRDVNAWLWACGGGERAMNYPYGNDLDASAGCVPATGGAFASAPPRPVGAACEGPVPGVFDMVGNVAEWIDSCDHDQCVAMGGSECKESSLHRPEYDPIEFNPYNFVLARGIRCCGVDPPAP